ncbi:hypothetical protein RJT34_29848 [Clitoria ternatea]|uniref:Uncharacterized protein n=1 Tax=Clitoria ternatea TaxID=43366 RepID=A0AAN9I1H3_CLITE
MWQKRVMFALANDLFEKEKEGRANLPTLADNKQWPMCLRLTCKDGVEGRGKVIAYVSLYPLFCNTYCEFGT